MCSCDSVGKLSSAPSETCWYRLKEIPVFRIMNTTISASPFDHKNENFEIFSSLYYDNVRYTAGKEIYFQTFYVDKFDTIPDNIETLYIQCFDCNIAEKIPIIISPKSVYIQHPIIKNIPVNLKYIHIKHSVFPKEWFRLPYGCELYIEACCAHMCDESVQNVFTEHPGRPLALPIDCIEGYLQDFNMRD
jgi:hypothetical protein